MGKLVCIKVKNQEKPLYDIEVQDNHNFVVNDGIVIKNSEQYLSRDSLCVLASLNAGRFSTNKIKYEVELSRIGQSMNRFLDNVNEMELRAGTYATPHQKLAIEMLRRTGAGYTNIAAWLFKQNLNYGSSQGNAAVEKFTERFNYHLYKSSIEIGKEKGSFGLFNKQKFEKSPFVQRMMKLGLRFDAMRNVTCSSIAPAGCIHEDTRIMTDKGLVRIKDLVDQKPEIKCFEYNIPEYNVYTENDSTPVTAFYNNGVVEGYKITLGDGRVIRTSEKHRLRAMRNGSYCWLYAPEIRTDDILVSRLGYGEFHKDVSYVELDSTKTSSHFNVSDVRLPTVMDERFAEFMGLFTGDGSTKFRQNGKFDGLRFPIYTGDPDMVDYYQNAIKTLFGLDSACEAEKYKQLWTVSCHSINLCYYMDTNGLNKKSEKTSVAVAKEHKIRVPEVIFRSPRSVIAAYIRGLFEADGTASKGDVSLYSKDVEFLREVQELLTSLGVQSYIREIDRTEDETAFNDIMYSLQVRYKNDCIRFRDMIGFISARKRLELEKSVYILDREPIYIPTTEAKRLRTEIAIEVGCKSKLYARINVAVHNTSDDNGLTRVTRDLLTDISKYVELKLPFNLERLATTAVVSVEREEFQTYDIEVADETHTYVTANGLINHNTLSLMFRDLILSYGAEPAFGPFLWKRTRISGKYEYYFCVPSVVREVLKEKGVDLGMEADALKDTWDGSIGRPIVKKIEEAFKKYGIEFKNATDVSPLEKLDLMSGVMKWCDSSISVTYMLPENTKWEDIADFIIQAHKKEVKSIAAFPDRKMYGIVSFLPFKELAIKLTKEGINIHNQNFSGNELEELQKETSIVIESGESIVKTNAPKRPKSLNCDVHHIRFTKKLDKKRTFDYVVVVGLLNNEPYEIFGMENGHLDKTYTKGVLTKEKKGVYSVTFDDGTRIEDITESTSEEEDMFTRMASAALRHGADISYIVDQLEKADAEEDIKMWSFSSAMARALKKYIKDGSKVTGQSCSACGGKDIIRKDGCWQCVSCGNSKCS